MAKFKCKMSGVVVEFVHEVDIKTTMENENYELIQEVQEKPKAKVKVEAKDEE